MNDFHPSHGENRSPASDPGLGVSYTVPLNVALFSIDFCFCLSYRIRNFIRPANPAFLILSVPSAQHSAFKGNIYD